MKKTTAIILSVLMLFSVFGGMSASAVKETGTGGYADYKAFLKSGGKKVTDLSGAHLASMLFDFFEEDLQSAFEDKPKVNIGSTENPAYLYLTGIDEIISSVVDILDENKLGGDWAKINYDAIKGLSRDGGDLEIIYAVFQLLADNAELVVSVIDCKFDYGDFLKETMGDDYSELEEEITYIMDYIFDVETIVKDTIELFDKEYSINMPENYTLDQWMNTAINFGFDKLNEKNGFNLDIPVDITEQTVYDIIKNFIVSLTKWNLLDDSISNFIKMIDNYQVLQYLYYSDFALAVEQQGEVDELNAAYPDNVEIEYQSGEWTFFTYGGTTYARNEKTENEVTTVSYLDLTGTENCSSSYCIAVDEQTALSVINDMTLNGIQQTEDAVIYTYNDTEYVIYGGNVYGFFKSFGIPIESTTSYYTKKSNVSYGSAILVERKGNTVKAVRDGLTTVYDSTGKANYVCQAGNNQMPDDSDYCSFEATVLNDYSMVLKYINPKCTLTMEDFGVTQGYESYNSILEQLNHILYVAINKALVPQLAQSIGWVDGDNSQLMANIDRILPTVYNVISDIVSTEYQATSTEIMQELGLTQQAFDGGFKSVLLSVLSSVTRDVMSKGGKLYTEDGKPKRNSGGYTIASEFTSLEQVAAVWCSYLSDVLAVHWRFYDADCVILRTKDLYNEVTDTDRTFKLTSTDELRSYCMLTLSEILSALANSATNKEIGLSWSELAQKENDAQNPWDEADIMDDLFDDFLYYFDGLFAVYDNIPHEKGVTDGNGVWYKFSKILNELLPTTLINGCEKTYGDETLGFDFGVMLDKLIDGLFNADVEEILTLLYRNTSDKNELFNAKPVLLAVLGLIQRIVNSVLPDTIEDDMLVSADEFISDKNIKKIILNLCSTLNNRKTGIIPSALAILNMCDIFTFLLIDYYPDTYEIKRGQTIEIGAGRDVERTIVKVSAKNDRYDYRLTVTSPEGKSVNIDRMTRSGDVIRQSSVGDNYNDDYAPTITQNNDGSISAVFYYCSNSGCPYFKVCNDDGSDAPITVTFDAIGGDFNYTHIGDEDFVRLWSYIGEDEQLIVPETLEYEGVSYPVALDDFSAAAVEKLIIPAGVRTVKNVAKMNSSNVIGSFPLLKEIVVDEENQYFKTIDGALYSKDGKALYCVPCQKEYDTLTVADTVEKIAINAFDDCNKINEVVLNCPITYYPDNYYKTVVLYDLNDNPNFRGITAAENDENYVSENGILYSKDKSILYIYPSGCKNKEYVVPETVNTLKTCCFGCNPNLETLKFTGALEQFSTTDVIDCKALKNLYFLNPQVNFIVGNYKPYYTVYGYPNSSALQYALDEKDKFVAFDGITLQSATLKYGNSISQTVFKYDYYFERFNVGSCVMDVVYSDGKTAEYKLATDKYGESRYVYPKRDDITQSGVYHLPVNVFDIDFEIPLEVRMVKEMTDIELEQSYYFPFTKGASIRFTTDKAGDYYFCESGMYYYKEGEPENKIYSKQTINIDYVYGSVMQNLEANTTYIIGSDYESAVSYKHMVSYIESYNPDCSHENRTREIITEASCTCQKKEQIHCEDCGMTFYYYTSSSKATHNFEETSTLEKTNVKDGSCITRSYYETAYTCKDCGQLVYTDAHIGAYGSTHSPLAAVTENENPATCKADGSYDSVVYCADCGVEISRETKKINKLAHSPLAAVTENENPATCKADGSYDSVVYCGKCGVEISREAKIVSAFGHIDYDGDGACDSCSQVLVEKELSFGEKIAQFFQTILNWFKNLFSFI